MDRSFRVGVPESIDEHMSELLNGVVGDVGASDVFEGLFSEVRYGVGDFLRFVGKPVRVSAQLVH